jgi:hypothetical protein
MDQIIDLNFSLILRMRAGSRDGGRNLVVARFVCFVVFLVEKERLGAKTIGCRKRVARVTLANICHSQV